MTIKPSAEITAVFETIARVTGFMGIGRDNKDPEDRPTLPASMPAISPEIVAEFQVLKQQGISPAAKPADERFFLGLLMLQAQMPGAPQYPELLGEPDMVVNGIGIHGVNDALRGMEEGDGAEPPRGGRKRRPN